jgi:hypothetical protein
MEGILFDNNGFHMMVSQRVVLEPKLDVLSSRGDFNNVKNVLWHVVEMPHHLDFHLSCK